MTRQIEIEQDPGPLPWCYPMVFSSGFFLSLRDRWLQSRWGWREGIFGAECE